MYDDILGVPEPKKTKKKINLKKSIHKPIEPIKGAKDANVNGETCEGCGNHIDECDCPEDCDQCKGCEHCDPWAIPPSQDINT